MSLDSPTVPRRFDVLFSVGEIFQGSRGPTVPQIYCQVSVALTVMIKGISFYVFVHFAPIGLFIGECREIIFYFRGFYSVVFQFVVGVIFNEVRAVVRGE